MNAPLLKWQKGGLKTPLSRARGLGAAKSGVHHWMMQRVSAVAAIPLTAWLVYQIPELIAYDHAAMTAWLATPVNAILTILTVITFFYHAMLGNQVVIEDYIHNEAFKTFKLVANRLVMFAACVACVFAILKVAL